MRKTYDLSVSDTDAAKMAAFIDGEGYIGIKRRAGKVSTDGYLRRLRYWLDLRVANTDVRLPHWCMRTFGGRVYVHTKQKYRELYSWVAIDGLAAAVLQACLPHFVIKREQAEVALAFRDTFSRPVLIVEREGRQVRRLADPTVVRSRGLLRERLGALYSRTTNQAIN